MNKFLTVKLNELEYTILNKDMKIVKGEGGEKLRNLLRFYIATIPELKSSDYALKRYDTKEELEKILYDVWDAYETTDYPTENWDENRVSKLISDLIEINALIEIADGQLFPSNKFRGLFKMLLYDIATEDRDLDEYSAACVATIQLLMEFGHEGLSRETLRDGTIFINEEWMFIYAATMKRARDYMKTRELFPITSVPIPEQELQNITGMA